jgi:hypothetical protein
MIEVYYLIYAEDEDWAGKRGINEDLLLTSLRSLRRHTFPKIVLVLPQVEKRLSEETIDMLRHNLCVESVYIPEEGWRDRRMLCRLEQFGTLLESLPEGCCIISGESDEIFLDNPFKFFEEEDFDIGLASRNDTAELPVNTGLVFFRRSDKVINFYFWMLEQIRNPDWKIYMDRRHPKNTHDIYCDRDMWCAVWDGRKELREVFGVNVKLFDCGYLMDEAIEKGQCSFHLKGQNKKRIYEENFLERILL